MTRNAVHNLRLFRSRAAKLSLAFGLFLSFNPSVLSAQTRSLTIRTYLSPPIEAFDRIRLIPNLPAANGSSCDPGSFYLNSSAGPLFCDNGTWRSFSSVWSKNDDILTLKNTDWQYQRVGIGTSEPQFKLSLDQDGGILAKDVLAAGSSSYSNPPEIRDSAALLWSPRTASLRAGEVRGPTLWRSTNISSYSTVFGLNNTTTSVGSAYSSILGGENNLIANTNFSTIIGGMNNALDAPSSGNFQAILGGSGNLIGSYNCNGCLIGGGQSNTIRTSFYSAIGGGSGNFMDRGNGYNAIIGGSGNMIQLNEKSFIGGGQNNLLTMETLYDAQNLSLIPNSQPAFSSIIGGGGNGFTPVNGLPSQGNLIGGSAYSMIGGGSGNQVRGLFYNVVYGGQNNRIVALNASLQPKNIHASSIGGGKSNTVLSSFSLIGGGESNVAGLAASSHEANRYATVIGGFNNEASGHYSFVGGGQNNTASGDYATVGGGNGNTASGDYSFVGGGSSNSAQGDYSAVFGGQNNAAFGDHSFAGGRNMAALGARTFIWGHDDTVRTASRSDTFIIMSQKVGFGTLAPEAKLHVKGNVLIESTSIPYSLILSNPPTLTTSSWPMNVDTSIGTIGFDIAEEFASTQAISAGDVLVMDTENPGHLKISDTAYSPRVVGVASQAPAVILKGSQMELKPNAISFETGTTPPVALKGRVAVKVCLENGPIMPGDALTTASIPGHAMRAADNALSTSAIIGKALERFDGSENQTGMIAVFVSLY